MEWCTLSINRFYIWTHATLTTPLCEYSSCPAAVFSFLPSRLSPPLPSGISSFYLLLPSSFSLPSLHFSFFTSFIPEVTHSLMMMMSHIKSPLASCSELDISLRFFHNKRQEVKWEVFQPVSLLNTGQVQISPPHVPQCIRVMSVHTSSLSALVFTLHHTSLSHLKIRLWRTEIWFYFLVILEVLNKVRYFFVWVQLSAK